MTLSESELSARIISSVPIRYIIIEASATSAIHTLKKNIEAIITSVVIMPFVMTITHLDAIFERFSIVFVAVDVIFPSPSLLKYPIGT